MRVVVVGAGVSGLVAARDLAKAGAEVSVLEASEEIGGKLRTAQVAGVTVDVGAEATLARRPEALELFDELGLTPIHPTAAGSRIWVRDALRPMPPSLMGAPSDFAALEASGILTASGLERARAEADLAAEPLAPGEDIGVGQYLEDRFGPEVVDTLVDPLLGGVYAGQARQISLRAAVPQLAAMATRGALGPQLAALPPRSAGPVFAGLAGGMGQLPPAIAVGLDIRLGAEVTALRQVAGGWSVELAGAEHNAMEADAVVLATPAWVTADLLGGLIDDDSRAALEEIDYASVAVITLAFHAADLDVDALQGDLSGFLVPPTETLGIKASTFSFAKWEWVREAGEAAGVLHLRTSVGRHGDTLAVDLSDAELLAVSLSDLDATTGLKAVPVDVHVQRWERGLPQYAIGHLDRVAQIQAAVAQLPGITVSGAAYEGVGVPAVIASGRKAAAAIIATVGGDK